MDNVPIGHIFLFAFGGLFLLWLFTGGPSRIENQYNPFVRPQDNYIGIPEIYGNTNLTEFNQTLIDNETYEGWNVEESAKFSVLLPSGWFQEQKAEFTGESFGEISNGSILIQYEAGKNVGNFSRLRESQHEFGSGQVGGAPTTFVRPNSDSSGTTGAHIIRSKKESMLIFTTDRLTEEEQVEVFTIIQSVRFK
jgi:hypothetical protein